MLRGNKVLIPDIYRNLLRPQQCRLFRSFLFRRICPLYAVHTVHTVIFARICSPFPKIRHQSELSSLNHPPFQNISSSNSSCIAAHSTPFFFLWQANTVCESSVFSCVFFFDHLASEHSRRPVFMSIAFMFGLLFMFKKLFLRLYDSIFFLVILSMFYGRCYCLSGRSLVFLLFGIEVRVVVERFVSG